MRTLLRALLLLLALTLAITPFLPASPLVSPVVADDDGDDGGEDDGGDDDDGKKDKDRKNKGNKKQEVETTADYTIDIDCAAGEATGGGGDDDDDEDDDGEEDDGDDGGGNASTTTCTFTAIEPEGGKKVTHVLIPAEVACADASGDVTWVDDDPNFNRAGYRHEGQKPFEVVFEDAVTTGGEATYWVKAADRTFPVSGPGLICGEQEQDADASTPEPTATETPTTGTILVTTYDCPGISSDDPEVDWFADCTQGGASTFELTGDGKSHSLDTTADGTATFAELAPATYDLDDTTRDWCHAESDSVNTEGQVVVEAGVTSQVWIFYCT